MTILDCEECNQPLDDDSVEGLCPSCLKMLREADKDREFEEQKALGYL